MNNPYRPPREATDPLATVNYDMPFRTQFLLIMISIAFGMGYQSVQNLRLHSYESIPVWPHLAIPTLLSMVAAIKSENLIAPPLIAFSGIMAGLMVFGAFRGFSALQIDISFPVAIASSVPSLTIVLWNRIRSKGFSKNELRQ